MCLDRSANHVDCHRALAVMLVEQNRTADAYRLLERWSMSQPTFAPAKVELARLYQEQGQREPARNMLIQALAANPYEPRALAALGRMYEEDGDRNSALANYQRSLQANPLQPELSQRIASLAGPQYLSGQMYPGQVYPGQFTPPYGTRTVTQPAMNSQRY
jgi:tetratricopeptide (TPR) repeat protein